MSKLKKIPFWVYWLAGFVFVIGIIIGYYTSINYIFIDEKKEYSENHYEKSHRATTEHEEYEEYEKSEDYEEYSGKENKGANVNIQVPNKSISKEELAKHNKNSDCWVVYKGVVYDVTAWLEKHPGGAEKIAQFCGSKEFEQGFVKKHKSSTDKKLNEAARKGFIKAVGEYQD